MFPIWVFRETEEDLFINRSEGLTNEALLDCFISGLQEDIRRDVKSLEPSNLIRAVALAKLFEEKYTGSSRNKQASVGFRNNSANNSHNTVNQKNAVAGNRSEHVSGQNKGTLPPLLPTPNTKPMNVNGKNVAIKSMSAAEIQLRRDKGLCYFCDDKFSYTHKCPNKHKFMMLQLSEDEAEEEVTTETTTEKGQDSDREEHHLSLNAMKGGTGVGTIRFSGRIGHIPIQILVDGGSSENFVQPRIVQCLKLPVEPVPSFRVLIGNGQYMQTEGWIEKLSVQVQGNELTLPVYVLPVVGADLILGSSWLATLGPHVADYATAVLKFSYENKFVVLKGDRKEQPTEAQLHQLKRMNNTDALCECFTVQMLQPMIDGDKWLELLEDMEPELVTLLQY